MKKFHSSFPFYISFGLLVVLFCSGRFVLVREVVEAKLVIQAVLADLSMAIFIALLAVLSSRIHALLSSLVLLFFCIFHIANMEMAVALNTFINIIDFHYAKDMHFWKGSLSNLTFPWYSLFLFLAAILYLVLLTRKKKNRSIRPKYVVLYTLGIILSVLFLPPAEDGWQSSSLLWLSLRRSFTHLLGGAGNRAVPKIKADMLEPMPQMTEDEHEPYLYKPPHSERNLLFIVLEGIPGVYVRQVQEWTGVRYPVEMPNLSRIAARSLIVPNFVAHNRQTMRGLYSLLSGDYCKLFITTPKIYEYMQLPPERRNPCLPEVMAEAGYTTVYLQAADLAFMSKNKFMSAAGFQQIFGKEFFQYQHVPFGWGPDDKAFFEQAADFIEDLDKKSEPWFVTLLNVGTHHPYAVPKEMAADFSSRKEAAVEYLDSALGDLFDRLKGSGILNDTLVFVTCDESHGVTGQPYGNYWGLAVVYTPESSEIINPGVYGLVDVPYSILDYLGMDNTRHSFQGRSFFRKQKHERPILFHSYFSESKGVVKKRVNNNCVRIIRSSNGELFGPDYVTELMKGSEGSELSDEIRTYQLRADNSLCDSMRKDRRYVLLENDVFFLGPLQSTLLSSGQYLDLPANTSVTTELKVSIDLIDAPDTEREKQSVRLVLQMLERYQKIKIPEIDIPVLNDHDSFTLSFSFYTEDPLFRVWAYLKAISLNKKSSVRIRVEYFQIITEESDSDQGFRMHHFFLQNDARERKDLDSDFIDTVQMGSIPVLRWPRPAFMQNTGNALCVSVRDEEPLHIAVQDIPDTEKGFEVTFRAEDLDGRYESYIISILCTHPDQGLRNAQGVYALLNGTPAPCVWLGHAECDIEVLLYAARAQLRENDFNTLSIAVDDTEAIEKRPSPRGKIFPEFELHSLALVPAPPPVAHAGGGYKALTYTNSLEALEENATEFTLFEIDFEWTKDNRLVGLHDWGKTFTRLFGFETPGPLDYNAFRGFKTRQDITPVDLKIIGKFLAHNPGVKIVPDTKRGTIHALKRIADCFPHFAEQFIPQVYQPEEYSEAIGIGYRDIIWTLYQYRHVYDRVKILSHLHRWEEEYNRKPFAVAMPVHAVERGVAWAVMKAGVPVYVHTINSCDEYVRLLQLKTSSIYTDFLHVTDCYRSAGSLNK
jgi:hypothetical protein